MAFELTENELRREKEFLKRFNQLCFEFGFKDTPIIIGDAYLIDIAMNVNVANDSFVNSSLSNREGQVPHRITIKGKLYEVPDSKDEKGENMIRKLGLNIKIAKTDERITLSERGTKLTHYIKEAKEQFEQHDTSNLYL